MLILLSTLNKIIIVCSIMGGALFLLLVVFLLDKIITTINSSIDSDGNWSINKTRETQTCRIEWISSTIWILIPHMYTIKWEMNYKEYKYEEGICEERE